LSGGFLAGAHGEQRESGGCHQKDCALGFGDGESGPVMHPRVHPAGV
jgi:hypothetical protein